MKTKTLRHHINRSAVALLAATTLPLSSFVVAQSGDQIEEVIVTGSRIARDSNLTGALPIQSVSAADIRASGEFSLSDVINDIPALLSSVTSEQSIDSGFSTGANVLNLRGLGAERTLVLVDGRRHVGGLQGASSVDIGSIPQGLVEKVEVLTGGASAVYGADAVTGVVNFILKDDFEGLEIDANYGLSQEGDGGQRALSVLFGRNFDNGRGNFTISADVRQDDGLQVSDRRNGLEIGSSGNWVNPALRFQQGDIGSDTPNFGQYYNYNNTGLTNFGLPIPSAADFATSYSDTFGNAPTLTTAETALINQAGSAPQRAVLPFRTFPFTSGYGYIIPGNPFTFDGFDPETPIDLNGNGTPDCLDSFTGYNSVFGAESFGVVGGCWNVSENGQYAPVTDGLVSGNFQGFGGDSYNTIRNRRSDILVPDDKISLNFLGHYDLNDQATLFGEVKYVTQENETDGNPNSFWDLMFGASDNPYLPDFIRPIAQATGGVAITIDPLLFNQRVSVERDTSRAVLGIEGSFDNGWTYEFSGNYGRFEQDINRPHNVINDRLFAAIDATTDAGGSPACRSSVDPSAPALNTPFEIPAYEAGYFSFTPGDGSCVPLNIWAGQGGVTQAAADWVTTPTWDNLVIEQLTFAATIAGDFSEWFELPAGAVSFATGLEYRVEESEATYDAFQLGILPEGTPFKAGQLIEEVSDNGNLVFRPQLTNRNESGSYNTRDAFIELSLPLLSGVVAAQELTVDVAGRYSDYSTIGEATSWKVGVVWAPIEDLAFRGGISQAVRAPNITELFGPETGQNYRPIDPCDAAQINALAGAQDGLAANYQANCVAQLNSIGLDPFSADGTYEFADPLSASFGGVKGGNRNLTEETAETITYGLVYQPSYLSGFSLTADYWEISIDDAIESVGAQDIVDGCYQGAALNATFCNSFTRNTNSASAQYGGFNFLRSGDVNFAKLETSGIDISASYTFDIRNHNFVVSVTGTEVNEIDFFTNPADASEVNPELGEVNRPETAGNVAARWSWGNLSVGWQSQYLGEMLLGGLEIETAQTLYGSTVFMEETWLHDINATYTWNESLTIRGGVNNISEEDPFGTNRAFPASPRGRMMFIGGTYKL
jgi:iron complex outermembrane receptor protein